METLLKIIVSGLDNAGKTSILTALDKKYDFHKDIVQLKPTIRVEYHKIGIEHIPTQSEISSFNYFKLVRNLYAHRTGKVDLKFASKIYEYASEDELPRDMFLSDKFDGRVCRINDISHRDKIHEIIKRFDESFLRCYYDIAFPGTSTIY